MNKLIPKQFEPEKCQTRNNTVERKFPLKSRNRVIQSWNGQCSFRKNSQYLKEITPLQLSRKKTFGSVNLHTNAQSKLRNKH